MTTKTEEIAVHFVCQCGDEIDHKHVDPGIDVDVQEGQTTQALAKEKYSRNAPCHCGSGKKYKKCHGLT